MKLEIKTLEKFETYYCNLQIVECKSLFLHGLFACQDHCHLGDSYYIDCFNNKKEFPPTTCEIKLDGVIIWNSKDGVSNLDLNSSYYEHY